MNDNSKIIISAVIFFLYHLLVFVPLVGSNESALRGSKDAPLPLTLKDFENALSRGTHEAVKDAKTEESTEQRENSKEMKALKSMLQPFKGRVKR